MSSHFVESKAAELIATTSSGKQQPARDCREEHGARRSLRAFAQAYWLRPENALWMALRSHALADQAFARPSIDLSCGDGVFSFLHADGRFAPDFDVFGAVTNLDRVRDDHADIFDHVDETYAPAVLSRPDERIDVGTDLKRAMLAKARCLHLHERLVRHDHNDPLPFDSDSFETVYCNSAYWVTRVDQFLGELSRITRPGGRVILQIKLDSMRRYNLSAFGDVLGERFLDVIGRGRLASWPALADRSTWERRFQDAGLSLKAATPFVTRTHAMIWDVGLRPFAPILIKMANALAPETRSVIKRDWVDLICELLMPFCDPTLDLAGKPDEPAEIQYVLTP